MSDDLFFLFLSIWATRERAPFNVKLSDFFYFSPKGNMLELPIVIYSELRTRWLQLLNNPNLTWPLVGVLFSTPFPPPARL